MEAPQSQHANAYSRPLLTQPQSWDEASETFFLAGKNISGQDQEANRKIAGNANGFSLLAVEECDVNDSQDEDFGDGFNLLTQSNDRFKDSALNIGEFSIDGSSDDSGESSSIGDNENGSDSSTDDEKDETPLQERRERNIRRNEAFAKTLKSELNAMNNTLGGSQRHGRKRKVATEQENHSASGRDVDEKEKAIERQRRGMGFSNSSSNELKKSYADSTAIDLPLTAKSLVDELKPKYPHRSKQIGILCSQLVTIVQKSKFAWEMNDNARSPGNNQYSEASYQGDKKLAAPSPILITGAGGVGKTCIVLDAVKALQTRTRGGSESGMHPTLSHAYVDCASSESGSVAAVMNNAYRQLHECCQLGSSVCRLGKTKSVETGNLVLVNAQPTLGADSFGTDFESEAEDADAEDEDADAEDLIERQRKQRSGKSSGSKRNKKLKTTADKTKMHKVTLQKYTHQTRLRTTLATKAASKPASEKLNCLKGSIQGYVNRNTQNVGSVALFGRATSALIQGGTMKKKSSKNWRCAFLILDNVDRILSWKRPGSINPLTQIFLLPSIMGINLTLIFISRSTIFQYSPVHYAPASLLDAAHPQKIHFDSYTTVEMIKTILHVPHVKLSITGYSTSASHMFSCAIAKTLRSKLNELLYDSMLNSYAPSVKSSTLDITEIMRLARLLWPKYVAPLEKTNDRDDRSWKTLLWQILHCLRRDAKKTNDHCHSNCRFCQCLIAETDIDASVMDLNVLKQRLSEKLDRNSRDYMRCLLSSAAMMPGRVLQKQNIEPYAKRLPHTTKFLLLAAFLCQNKRPEHDVNLFTTKNTGKSKRSHTRKSGGEGLAYISSFKEMKQRQPSFPLERLFSVFYSLIGQYGQHFMNYKEEGVSVVAQLGTECLFQNVSQLITSGLLSRIGNVKFDGGGGHELLDMMSAKFSCTIIRDDAHVIASSVGFPLEKYCP
eukprot:CAMPEP_0172535628 /NCGR_PEP_ID=MMETSP1067-20121228/7545_1 /TAXON_ID=265564 ORGANISM="Thalassiosira punctigera, Strain Tpunct2005C2" /NCGR_SAMPLE_ID=MMETSP1067 /ASSEMBLY_ACC=CAM_ASM_000444 /LENGTH=949 /DNA_ID=CAMNT_0013320565 /DNA_START=103 /DNA_END=2952 /DNA_ORIENTATION=+